MRTQQDSGGAVDLLRHHLRGNNFLELSHKKLTASTQTLETSRGENVLFPGKNRKHRLSYKMQSSLKSLLFSILKHGLVK